MSLRATGPLLSGGGGLGRSRNSTGNAAGGANTAWFSRLTRNRYGPQRSSPHVAARWPGPPRWKTRTTMGYHMVDQEDYVKLGFKQHLDLPTERRQVVHESSRLIPSNTVEAYRQWKVDNANELKQYAGKYIMVEWELDEATGRGGRGGVVRAYEADQLATAGSDVKLLNYRDGLPRWIDYIPPQYGEPRTLPKNILEEEGKLDWNSTDFDDIDELKEWLDFEDPAYRSITPVSTPVSTKLKEGVKDASTPKPAIPHPLVAKWLTFNSPFPYNTEQFSPWFWNDPDSRTYDTQFVGGKWKTTLPLGVARDFVPATHFMQKPSTRKSKPFEYLFKLYTENKVLPTKVSADYKEVWLSPSSRLLRQTFRRTFFRPKRRSLLNLTGGGNWNKAWAHPNRFSYNYTAKSMRPPPASCSISA